MKGKRPPKTIATINFKGGVGKTTITWCLGDLVSTYGNSNVLLFDLDAQMSLTQAITLNEDGSLYRKFSDWSDRSEKKDKSIFKAIEAYTGNGSFDFGINLTNRYTDPSVFGILTPFGFITSSYIFHSLVLYDFPSIIIL